MSGLATALPPFEIDRETGQSGVSSASQLVLRNWIQARAHSRAPISREPIGHKFVSLAATWREEIQLSSSFTDWVLNYSYQRIIGLGPSVVPSILLELAYRPDHWFWALHALTGVNPVPPEAAGNLKEMTRAWLRWGEEQGLLD